ncbi:hypothetical protein HRR82_003711 [Exophiala dermatitidis]|nr:hypothetical protein HRR82_003711 [Exophiala dermatitidis]
MIRLCMRHSQSRIHVSICLECKFDRTPDFLEGRSRVGNLGLGLWIKGLILTLVFVQPDWPRFFSYSPDIWKYLDKVCEVFDLRKYMVFNTEVIGCYWQEETGEWLVKLKETNPKDGSTVRLFEDRCHVLLHGTGILNNFKWPDIEGMDKFKGRIIHTARWPKEYQAEEWKKDRVAVIGSGGF